MKNLRTTFLLAFVLSVLNINAQNQSVLEQDMVNIATLIVDFDTYEFEGGNLSTYVCEDCNYDSIPLHIEFDEPGDFGGMIFTLAPTSDTLFDATIIWMGLGEISKPNDFTYTSPFSESTILTQQPEDLRLLDFDGELLDQPYLLEKIDSVWDVVDSLEITKNFSENGFETLIYFYPPAIGMIDPTVAKWVIFLYQKQQEDGIIDYELKKDFTIYPNPAINQIKIASNFDNINNYNYQLIDITGSSVQTGKIKSQQHKIDISNAPDGIYFIQIFDENRILKTTKKLIKR